MRFIYALAASSDHRSADPFIILLRDPSLNQAYLQATVEGAMTIFHGRRAMLRDAEKDGVLPEKHRREVVKALSKHQDTKEKVAHLAKKLNEQSTSENKGKTIPELMKLTGNAAKGKALYSSFCIACHIMFQLSQGMYTSTVL